jgi:hypothetical protein
MAPEGSKKKSHLDSVCGTTEKEAKKLHYKAMSSGKKVIPLLTFLRIFF